MHKNYFLLPLFLVATFSVTTAQNTCLPNGFIFTRQGQIDSFSINYPGCTHVLGDIEVREETIGGITNLNGFYPIKICDRSFKVFNNNEMEYLSGLDSLTYIGKLLVMQECYSLKNLSGLDNLKFVGATVSMFRNIKMKDLHGLENLEHIGGALIMNDNFKQTSLKGVEKVSFVGGGLHLWHLDSLSNLNSLESIKSIGEELILVDNPILTDISSLSQFVTIPKTMYIWNNKSLTNLHGLHNVTSIGEDLVVWDNDALTNLDDLSSLTTLGEGAYIIFNDKLTSIAGLKKLESINGVFKIQNNPALQDLGSLEHIDPSTIADLVIENNTNLSVCAVEGICNHLKFPSATSTIYNNAPGCNSPDEVKEACLLLSTNGIDDTAFQITPNPTNGSISISGIDTGRLTLADNVGRIVFLEDFHGQKIDISNLPNGMYFLQIRVENHLFSKKIIKQ